jgi:hypothetical protein
MAPHSASLPDVAPAATTGRSRWPPAPDAPARGGVTVSEAVSARDRRAWIHFQSRLYRGDPNFVPPLLSDERSLFSPRNPAHDVARSKRWVARRDGRVVGRICGIVHTGEETKLGYRRGRFGWFETVDDGDVAHALLGAARDWLVAEGCTEMTGPHGFTDMDPEGLLVDGFDELPTIAASYHPRYYSGFIEDFGFEAVADYVEYLVDLPVAEPPLFARLRARYDGRSPYHALTCKTQREVMHYAPGFWVALEESFAGLYGVTPLSARQRKYYTDRFLGMLEPEFVHFAIREVDDEVVGFFVTMPNLSRAFQKARGRLLPTGFLHIRRGMKRCDTVDLLVAGVKQGHPSPLIAGLLAMRVWEMCRRRGIRRAETNHELESNTAVNAIWKHFDARLHRRSRLYRLPL